MKLLTLMIALMGLLIAPAQAQHADDAAYPTVTALQMAVLPPRDRVDLAQRLLGVSDLPDAPAAAEPRQVGDQQVFLATDATSNIAFEVPATLRVVGEHIYMWVQDGGRIDDADLKALAQAFDTRIYGPVRALWGDESSPGVDGDPRIYALFTHGLGPTTAAYFASDHTYPRAVLPTSNGHEMFFFNLDALHGGYSQADIESILAHEFQHMIRANLQPNEEYWINEGFSEFTQLYLYQSPGWEIISFMGRPDTQLNSWSESNTSRAANYGAALLFTTYLYERFGLEAVQRLSADPSARGLDSFDAVLRDVGAIGVEEFFADWVLANFLVNPDAADGRYGYPSLPGLGASALPLMQTATYPFVWNGMANQYATDYFVLSDVRDRAALTLELDVPAEVSMLPTTAPSGERLWYSNRGDMSDTTLTRAFDLSGLTSATLEYRMWHHTEALWDYGYVMISSDGGARWQILTTSNMTAEDPNNAAYGTGYTGLSAPNSGLAQWIDERIDLTPYVGGEVLVRFEMITDDGVNQHGMAVDDIALPELGYFSDFETDDGGWEARGWVWTDNRLPQQVWVQAAQQIGDQVAVTRWLAPSESSWTLPLVDGVDQVVVAISPFAPLTTVPMPYRLKIAGS